MSLTLLSQNSCNFSGCGLNFANLYDLIAHIEFAHIPLIEEEQRQKVNQGGEEARLTAAPNLPLSFFQRVFPAPYRPNPYPVHPVKVSFNHYRKRVPSGGSVVPNGGNTPNYMATPPRREEEDSNSGVSEDLDECSANDPELRFRCNVVDCGKRYKNSTGLKLHMTSSHGTVTPVASQTQLAQPAVVEAPPAAVPAIHLQPPSVSSPTKYAASRPHKCPQCSKRYKTVQGMQNHVQQAHQKLPPMGEDQPSPAALAQLIMQKTPGHVMQQSNRSDSQQQQRALPVSVASQPQQQQQYATGERGGPVNAQHTHLPVRSIQVQQNRMVPQGHSPITTGQMLHQQLMQQRRAAQQQQQQQQAQQGMQHQQQNNNYVQQGHQQQHIHIQNGHVPQQHPQPPHRPIVQHQMMMQQQQQQGHQHQMQQMAPPPPQQEMEMRRYAPPMNGQMGAGVESSYVPPPVEQVSQ